MSFDHYKKWSLF